jgi:cation:H+ antiporter
MIADILGLAISLAVLAVSGDQFVIGVARIAAAMRIRPTVVGAVIGGLGASLPELVVAGVAAARGTPGLAVGSAVGSIVANVCLALAVAALVAPVRVDSRTLRRESPISVAAVLLFALFLRGGLSGAEGAFLIVALAIGVGALVANAGRGARADELGVEVRRFFGGRAGRRPWAEIGRSLASLVFMVVGAEILVRSASGLAGRVGIGQGFIGLTLVAVGTSAPVIAIAIQAARRGNHDLVVGNVLGSNLFVALGGGAIVALVHGGSAASVGAVAVGLMGLVTVGAWAFMARGSRLTRWEALILIAAYGAALPFLTG